MIPETKEFLMCTDCCVKVSTKEYDGQPIKEVRCKWCMKIIKPKVVELNK